MLKKKKEMAVQKGSGHLIGAVTFSKAVHPARGLCRDVWGKKSLSLSPPVLQSLPMFPIG